jgi:hypothetical protein
VKYRRLDITDFDEIDLVVGAEGFDELDILCLGVGLDEDTDVSLDIH